MIQRIQSLYLLLAAVLTGLTFAMPLSSFLGGAAEMKLNALGFFDAEGQMVLSAYGLSALAACSALLALVIIFLFKKRLVQFRLCVVEMVLLAGTIVFEIYYIWGGVQSLGGFATAAWRMHIAALFPLFALIFAYLGLLGIRKDILLIRSLDRIR